MFLSLQIPIFFLNFLLSTLCTDFNWEYSTIRVLNFFDIVLNNLLNHVFNYRLPQIFTLMSFLNCIIQFFKIIFKNVCIYDTIDKTHNIVPNFYFFYGFSHLNLMMSFLRAKGRCCNSERPPNCNYSHLNKSI